MGGGFDDDGDLRGMDLDVGPRPARSGPSRAPISWGRVALRVLAGVVVAAGCCLGSFVTLALTRRPLRRLLATYDARLELAPREAPARPDLLARAASALRRRLDLAEVPARVTVTGAALVVDHRAEDAETVRTLGTRQGRLRFALVREEPGDPGDGVEAPAGASTLERLPQADGGGDLVVEGPGLASEDLVRHGSVTLDDLGRPAIGLLFSPAGGEAFHALTSRNVGRRLAIVLDDVIHSAPTIRAPIGRRAVIDGGASGWTRAQVRAHVALLEAPPLPLALEVVGP